MFHIGTSSGFRLCTPCLICCVFVYFSVVVVELVYLITAAIVAFVFLIVLITFCVFLIHRQCGEQTPKIKLKQRFIAETEVQESVIHSNSKAGSVLTNADSNIAVWTKPERKGKQTGEQVRRMKINDNFEDLEAPASDQPPPPILRNVDVDGKAPSHLSGSELGYGSKLSEIDKLEDEFPELKAGTSADSDQSSPSNLPPLHINQPHTAADLRPDLKTEDNKETDEQEEEVVTAPSEPQTPKPYDFKTPNDTNGYYKIDVK